MADNWEISKFEGIKMTIVLILVVCFIIWSKLDKTTGAQSILSGIKTVEFHGRVDSVYRDLRDHNNQKVRLNTNYRYALYPEWESLVDVGDSLSKDSGTTVVVIIKRNGKQINLDYKELVKIFKN